MTNAKKIERTEIFDEAGNRTGATFGVENRSGRLSIRFDSRGTTEGTRAYREGLELLLQRVADANLWMWDVCVETRTTGDLSRAERRTWNPNGPDNTLQDAVAIEGPAAVRKRLHTRAAKVGRPKGAKGGGNGTKRLRLYLHPDAGERWTADELRRLIARGEVV